MTDMQLLMSEQGLRALLKATSDVLYRMCADWSEMLPLDGRGLVAGTEKPISDWMEKNIPPEEHDRIRHEIKRATENRSIFQLEHKVFKPDGSYGWTSSRAVPIVDERGEITEWFGAAADVTERVEAQQELERQRTLYEAVLDTTPDLAYIFGLDHRFIYVNSGLLRMWGKTWDESIGKTCLELGYEPWHAEMHDREIDQVRETRQPLRGEVFFSGTYGRRAYDYIMAPVLNGDGDVVAVAGLTRDVTDYRETEERLEAKVAERTHELLEINEQLQGFTYSIAHDIRQQIRGINANAAMLQIDAGDALDVEGKAKLARLVGNAKQLATLVDDLLTYARLGRKEPEMRPIDLSQMAEEVAAHLLETGLLTPATQVKIAPGLSTRGDSAMLRIALDNLLENAAKYSAKEGAPVVEVGKSGDEFYVRDNGVGFDMAFAPKLFQPFERLHRDTEFSGTGIGLANVKRIVEKHGGTVRAEAELGSGATFYFTLPNVDGD